jgi:fructose-bisphosphate aldolase class II
MLVSGKTILDIAHENDFAVPAFNVSDHAMMNGLFEICEELGAPWILAIHPDELNHIGDHFLASALQRARASSVPVAIHWDHGANYQQAIRAISLGFTSVMIDKSMTPFEENVAEVKKVVEAAHAVGVSVEGELGTIGKTDDEAEDGAADIIYTKPEEAVEFIAQTGVDFLAIAIGTCHGIYPAHMKPELKLELLKEIKAATGAPLVLHGGSNNPDTEIGTAAETGVNKINISSDIKVAYHNKYRELLADGKLREPNSIQPAAQEAMKIVAAQKIELFGADGKAKLF